MEIARTVLDWILICFSTYMFLRSANKMVLRPNASMGHIVVAIVWLFCCLPILLDYLIGRPEYVTVYWYRVFIEPMANDEVSCLYDLLILLTLFSLYFYCNSADRNERRREAFAWSTPLSSVRPAVALAILSPVVYIPIAGLTKYYLTYGDPGSRGMPAGTSTMVTALLLISLISFCSWFFSKKRFTKTDYLILVAYSFMVAWISGKRFMIALMLLTFLFFYLNRDLDVSSRRKLKKVIPLALVALFSFSAFYLVGVRPLSDTSASSVYEMLRVDFGRDDVTKYVIYHEFFLGHHILDFPGQSMIATLFVWVPRILWPGKPFQHYQYLTSSILGVPIVAIPAGTTPSWWEMCLANFSYFGFFVAAIGLVLLVWWADKSKTVTTRATMLLIIIALLTQSIDAYISLVLLLIAQKIVGIFVRRKKPLEKDLHFEKIRGGR